MTTTVLKNNINIKCIDESLNEASITFNNVGNHFIGRGTFEQLQEKKCSRKQISIIINDDNTIFISSNGVNPSYLKKSDQEYFVQMNKDQNYILDDGDCFSLLFEMYTFLVTFKPNNNNNNQQQQHHNSSTDEIDEQQNKKRKQIDQEEEEFKKKKVESKPQCPYGIGCYRKNKAHLEEYDHPHKTTTTTTDSNKGTDNNNNNKHHNEDNVKIDSSKIVTPKDIPTPIIQQQAPPQPPTIVIKKQSPDTNKQISSSSSSSSPPTSSVTSSSSSSSPPTNQQKLQQQINTTNEHIDENNSNIGKILGPKYKKKKLSDALKERSLAFPFISTSTFGFNIEKATEIAAKAISEYLQFHEKEDDIKLKMMVEKSIYSEKLIESFKKKFNDKWDKRFEIIKIDNSNCLEQFNLGCKLFATEATWRLKKTPQNKQLYELLLNQNFEKETKARFPNCGKIGKVYPIPLVGNNNNNTLSNCPLHKEYGIDMVILVLGVNMNPNKPDAFKEDSELASPLLLETYHSLFNALDNF